MKNLAENLKVISSKHKGLMGMMILLVVLAVVLLIYSALCLQPSASVVKVGYGDIGGYQGGEWSSMANSGGYHDGSWVNILAFPLLAIVFGFLHNLLAVRLFEKKGEGLAKIFIVMTIGLVLATFIVLGRLTGEG